MGIGELRKEIDLIDDELLELFVKRMGISLKIGEEKRKSSTSVEDKSRQAEIINKIRKSVPNELAFYAEELYSNLFSLSKLYQRCDGLHYALIGKDVDRSFSTRIHSHLGKYDYRLLSMSENEFSLFIKHRSFQGINVTMPYKISAFKFCDVLSEDAKATGCVNTIVNKKGELWGYNTDINGFVYMVKKADINFEGKNVLILGTGGTSKTAEYASRLLGARNIYKASRNGKIDYNNIYSLENINIIVNTTPVGMLPHCDNVVLDFVKFKCADAYVDVVYSPLKTASSVCAQSLGLKTTCGLDMLCAQAFYASEFFTGRMLKKQLLDELCRDMHLELSNIVLIGMPGCGKSLIGKLIHKKTGRTWVDTDRLIKEKMSKSSGELICELGEEGFRDIESDVVREVSARNGCIISIGGGGVLRKKNRDVLSRNSIIVYIKRNISMLSTKGRPLSKNVEALNQMLVEREPIYEVFCDFKVKNNASPEICANEIIRTLGLSEINDENTCD